MGNYTFRLSPGQDLFDSIEAFAREKNVRAGCVLSSVGSLTHASLRFASQKSAAELDGFFEIVSMTGTVSIHGSHLHISVSDQTGRKMGGHLLPGCIIYRTAEIVLMAFDDVIYKREFAADSGYDELVVYDG